MGFIESDKVFLLFTSKFLFSYNCLTVYIVEITDKESVGTFIN